MYSKGVQTSLEESEEDEGSRRKRKLSARERDVEVEKLRQEIEAELKALHKLEADEPEPRRIRPLPAEELQAVAASQEFTSFIERSSKVAERALDEDYDILADYSLREGILQDGDSTLAGLSVRETASFSLPDSMGTHRMISSLDFSPKYPELLCAAYTKSQSNPHTPPGLLNVWNLHLKTRPEYSLHSTSDILSCIFHPYQPNLLLGGTYTGQVCLWDIRTGTGQPVSKTPLTGGRSGHAHPIYSLCVVGTLNASSIVSVSTDGVVCSWTPEMLSLPQEYLELHSTSPALFKTDEVAPTCISFPVGDPTVFLAGTEQGSILPVHRYDRAHAKAGVDTRVVYRGHTAPVTGVHCHPSRGPIDLADLCLSSGLDWSVKLWRTRPSATKEEVVAPLISFEKEDPVYDVMWHPLRPGVFATVDGAGHLDIHDLVRDKESYVARATTGESDALQGREVQASAQTSRLKSLNCLSWEKTAGKQVVVGGLEGKVTVFELGQDLTGPEPKKEVWSGLRSWIRGGAKAL
ncbi:WD40 repeat-like protein [Piedraia hortae CBS 480.64]|uniref:WD40 repeat-like protein n=1 Tax=Piedraia hortae CBS 480.64 TaxID=1314780 RepID=A0A6A7BTN9_9PEZI|nr:WD40 repeat-like protein [Piedraia hortae CBS 480.64]